MSGCDSYFLEDQEKLGQGSFGVVYKVHVYGANKVKSVYARKYFDLSADFDTYAREIADLRQRFNVEIKTQCILNAINRKCIAPIVMFDTRGDNPYFIMELADMSLLDAIRVGMDDSEKEYAVKDIINGVITIHNNHYLHRDLNPKNILKYPDGSYKITDFGLVKDLNALRAEIKTKFVGGMGTDGYMPLEVADSGMFSIQSDIYSVGKIISDIYNAPSPAIKQIIRKCLECFPEDRYEKAEDLMDDFENAIYVEAA